MRLQRERARRAVAVVPVVVLVVGLRLTGSALASSDQDHVRADDADLDPPASTQAIAVPTTPRPARAANIQMGFDLGGAQADGELGQALGPAAGMMFDLAYRPTSFLAVGGELGYFRYGWSYHRERFRLVDERGVETPLVMEYTRKNDLVPVLLTARLQLPVGPVRPYLQGLLGLTIWKTTVDFDRVAGDEDQVIDSWAQVASTRGFEVGLDLRLYHKRHPRPAAHDASFFLSLGVRRLWNGEATFGLPGSLAAGYRRSPSSFTVITLGFTGRADVP